MEPAACQFPVELSFVIRIWLPTTPRSGLLGRGNRSKAPCPGEQQHGAWQVLNPQPLDYKARDGTVTPPLSAVGYVALLRHYMSSQVK